MTDRKGARQNMATKAASRKKPALTADTAPAKIVGFKGFNSDWTCRGFKFEVGKTYKHDGPVVVCQSGFHACEDPFDVLSYYGYDGKFAEVELAGETARHTEDSKIVAAELTVKVEISIPEFIKRGVDYILARVNWTEAKETNTGYHSAATNTGDQSAATNTGDQSAATNTGDHSAATNTGNQSAATNTGNRSAATNTGYHSAATNTGDQSAATNTGKEGVALASGYQGRVMGADGCALFLVERDDNYKILAAWAGIVGRDGIKPDVFYTLQNGKPVAA